MWRYQIIIENLKMYWGRSTKPSRISGGGSPISNFPQRIDGSCVSKHGPRHYRRVSHLWAMVTIEDGYSFHLHTSATLPPPSSPTLDQPLSQYIVRFNRYSTRCVVSVCQTKLIIWWMSVHNFNMHLVF